MNETDGLIKLVGDAKTDLLLGMHIVAPQAESLIGEGVIALEMGATVEDIGLSIHPHPTLTESIMDAAEAIHGKAIHVLIPSPSPKPRPPFEVSDAAAGSAARSRARALPRRARAAESRCTLRSPPAASRDTWLVVEHDPVITLGRKAKPPTCCCRANCSPPAASTSCQVERGGDVTYHGPGQVVVYPIVKLERFREIVPLVAQARGRGRRRAGRLRHPRRRPPRASRRVRRRQRDLRRRSWRSKG